MFRYKNDFSGKKEWCPEQESNLCLALRRRSFYPLNYRGVTNETVSKLSGVYDTSFACQVQEKNNRMSGYMHYTGGRGGVAYVVGSLKFKYLFP